MPFEHLRLEHEREGAVATITIDRERVLNALSTEVIDDLRRAVLEARHDEAVRVVIITGAGGKAFVAGADINELARLAPADAKDYALRGQHVFDLIEHMGKPVIAAVNGYALGGGCEIALACHIRIAADTAKFGQPEVALGIIPGYGGTQRLPRIVGAGRAAEMILTGNQIDAAEAWRTGLVNKVVPKAELLNEAQTMARTMIAKGQIALRMSLKAINASMEMPLGEGLTIEASLFGECCSTADFREGTGAFLEKRKPAFTGK